MSPMPKENITMKEFKPAILLFIVFTIICGGIYPAVVTGVASIIFPKQFNTIYPKSLITKSPLLAILIIICAARWSL